MDSQFDESVLPDYQSESDRIDELLEIAKLPKYKNHRILNATDLIKQTYAPMQWAVKDILPEGCVLFAGRPKLGKSWLAYQIAVAVASGGEALGEIPVKQGDVLYLALEDGRQRLQWRLKCLLGDDPVPAALNLAMDWSALDDGGIEELEMWLRHHPRARLVIIDTFQRVRPNSSGTSIYSIDFNSLSELTDLTRRFSVCIMVVHHTRKANAEDTFDTVSGSTGLTGAVDATIVLKRMRGRSDAEMHVTGRDIEEVTKALRFDKLKMTWRLLGNASDVWQNADRAAIKSLLKDAPAGMRARQIADHLGKKEVAVRMILSRMLREGQITLIERGLYGIQGESSRQ